MRIATTTEDFGKVCNLDYAECIRKTYEAGFKYIDLSMYVVEANDPLFYGDDFRTYAESLNTLANDLGVKFVQAHSPRGNFARSKEEYEDFFKKTVRSIEVCGILGIKNTVVHPGISPDWSEEEFYRQNTEFYKSLIPTMEKCGVNVLCENCGEIKGYFVLSSAERANKLIELVNHPQFGICWDTGHANINGHQYDHITALGKNLRALHINDNRGVDDEHMAPFFGTVNMDEIINALLDIDYKGYFTFECGYSLRPTDLYLGARRRFEKDTRLLYPTLEMQSDMTNFLYKMGRHILNAYNIFEE